MIEGPGVDSRARYCRPASLSERPLAEETGLSMILTGSPAFVGSRFHLRMIRLHRGRSQIFGLFLAGLSGKEAGMIGLW